LKVFWEFVVEAHKGGGRLAVLKRLLIARGVVVAKSAPERRVTDALAVVMSTSELLAVPGFAEAPDGLDESLAVDVLAGGVFAGHMLEEEMKNVRN
jgi:hypothetical protein